MAVHHVSPEQITETILPSPEQPKNTSHRSGRIRVFALEILK